MKIDKALALAERVLKDSTTLGIKKSVLDTDVLRALVQETKRNLTEGNRREST